MRVRGFAARGAMRWRRLGVVIAAALLAAISGCSSVAYYAHSLSGHFSLLHAAQPVSDWLAKPDTPAALRQRLLLSQQLRDYASRELHLPDNQSYRRYADLQRSAALWNVVAAPELSFDLKSWCLPMAGCMSYRGYYSADRAEAEGRQLREQGFEVMVYPVPAYSTLGWSDWWGGDPLLSTFIHYPDAELARTIFHELAHQVAYAPGDTRFNESFATAVERLGSAQWLASQGLPAATEQLRLVDERREAFRRITLKARAALQAAYQRPDPPEAKRHAKAQVLADLRADYAQLKATAPAWRGYTGYDAWFATVNNAQLGVLAAYTEAVPVFEALFAQQGRDWPRFYAEVQRLARLPQTERDAALAALQAPPQPAAGPAP